MHEANEKTGWRTTFPIGHLSRDTLFLHLHSCITSLKWSEIRDAFNTRQQAFFFVSLSCARLSPHGSWWAIGLYSHLVSKNKCGWCLSVEILSGNNVYFYQNGCLNTQNCRFCYANSTNVFKEFLLQSPKITVLYSFKGPLFSFKVLLQFWCFIVVP